MTEQEEGKADTELVWLLPRGLQFVSWWPHWLGFFFTRLDAAKTDMAYVYEWYLGLGFWEIRKWSNKVIERPKQKEKRK